MQQLELVFLGASTLVSGSAKWQCVVPIGDEDNDNNSWGEVPSYQCLGVTCRPEGGDSTGRAEGILCTNVGGNNAVILGARDSRDADIIGNIDPGDTVIHATGKGKKPQFQLKKLKKAAAIVVPCEDGTDAVFIIDGKNNRAQIIGWGGIIQISKNDGITISDGKGGGLQIAGGEVTVLGTLRLPGLNPGMLLYSAPITGPLSAAPGSPVTGGFPVNGVGGTT